MPVAAEDREFVAQFAPHAVEGNGNYRQFARQAATQYGLDPDIFERQINQESGFNPKAHSPAGAQGIAQIMPATAKGWHVDPNDPNASLNAAAKNMASYVKTYGGDYAKALAAYNAGPGAVAKYGGVPPYKETKNYVNRIMGSAPRKQASGGVPQEDRAFVAQFAPQALPKESSPVRRIGQQALDSLNRPTPIEPPNFLSDLSGSFQNTISGYTRDDLARASGGGIGAGLGNIAGSLVDIGGAGLAGAGIGSIVPGVGTALGGTAGLVAGGAGLGALQEAQRERLAGEEYNPLKLVGAGAIGGLTSFPVGGAASTVAKTVLKNAAVDAGINTAGDVALQAVEKGTLDPRQLDLGRAAQAAGIGAVGGGLSGWHAAHAKVKQAAPAIAEKLAQGAPLDHMETRALGQILTPDEVQALQEGFRQRTVGEAPQIITQPFDEATAVRDLGLRQPVQEQVSDTGLTVTREGAGKPKAPPLEIDRGLPEGEAVDLGQPRGLKTESIIDPATGQPYKPTERTLRPSLDVGIERAERVYSRDLADVQAKSPAETIESPAAKQPVDLGAVQKETPGLLDAQGRKMGEALPPRDLASVTPRPTEPGDLLGPTGQPLDLGMPKYTQTDLSVPKQPPAEAPRVKDGAFTDTVNELLKDSGLDLQGVQNLKRELEAKRVEAEALKNNRGQSAEAKQARADLKQLNDQWKALDPNIREAASVDFDSKTGMGRQRAVDTGSQLSLDQIRGDLDERSLPLAERYAEAMQKGVKVRHKYIGEQVGRSNEVAKRSKGGRAVVETTEFSPTHFGHYNATFPDGTRKVPAVFGYNQRGHEVGYYLNKSPKGSIVQQVMAVTDKPAFRGAIPNIAQGSGQFNVSDILARGSRTERGFVKTSEAIKAIHEQKTAMREVMNSAIMPAEAKQKLTKVLSEQDFGYDDIRSLRETMSNPSRLAEFCTRMGLS